VSVALSHLRVIELCDGLAGAYCGRQFAAWGAEVVAVEPPGGSPLRRIEPCVAGRDGAQASLVWEYVAAGKRSAVGDLADDAGRARLAGTIVRADVFITDWSPRRLLAAGLDYASLACAAPSLIIVSITPFGADGPYAEFAASDLMLQALSGMLSLSGYPGRTPLRLPANILPYACGVSAFVGALAALHERRASGAGQRVEVACLEAIASLVLFQRAQYLGEPFPRRSGVGTVLLPCADGYVLCSPAVENVWNALLTALEIASEAVPESLRGVQDRYAALSAVCEFLAAYSQRHAARALFETLGTLHVVAGLLEAPADLLGDEHLAARGFFFDLAHPRLGRLRFPGPAGQLSETPMLPPRPAPERGSMLPEPPGDRDPVQGWVGAGAHRDAPHGASPLHGLRVLDLTGAWIGPYAAMLLADLGADVIKIESPRRPDVWRIFRPAASGRPELPPGANPRAHPWNTSFYYNAVNRNKRGIALDLASGAGREILLKLVAGADIVMENFTPRVMENFGLGDEALRRVRPDLIAASFSGYGASGPYRDYKANGATIETIAGWSVLFGYPDEPAMSLGEMEADPLSGLQMAALTLVALEHRACSGRGQRIDGSMFEAAAGYIGEELLLAGLTGAAPVRLGDGDRNMAPQGVFPCAGDDQWIAISVRDDTDWRALLSTTDGAARLHDDRFATIAGRRANAQEIEAALTGWTRTHEARDLMLRLQAAGVPAGVVLTTNEVPGDPQFAARGWFRPLAHPDLGERLYNGYPWRFSRSGLVWRRPPPRVGEHSAAVLAGLLALDAEAYAALAEAGVSGSTVEWPLPAEPAAAETA